MAILTASSPRAAQSTSYPCVEKKSSRLRSSFFSSSTISIRSISPSLSGVASPRGAPAGPPRGKRVHSAGSTGTGITMAKTLPPPRSLSTSTRPPCASAMCLTMESPIPAPLRATFRPSSTR